MYRVLGVKAFYPQVLAYERGLTSVSVGTWEQREIVDRVT